MQKRETVVFVTYSCGKLAGTERTLLNWCKFIDYKKINIIICANKGNFWRIFNEQVPYVKLVDYKLDNRERGIAKFWKAFIFFRGLHSTKVVWLFNGVVNHSLRAMIASWIVSKGNLYISHHILPKGFEHTKTKVWFGIFPGLGVWRIRKTII
ncbi:hypothetical protein ACFL4C_01585, partial [Candidatus Omnitrophota bacterium]